MNAVDDPRPRARIVDRDAGRDKLRREGRCRACGRTGLQHLSRAHLVSKGQRGDDVDDNIIPLCGSGTSGCHGALHSHHVATDPSKYTGQSWERVASSIRARLSYEEMAYIKAKKGIDWLNRTYPW